MLTERARDAAMGSKEKKKSCKGKKMAKGGQRKADNLSDQV